MYLNKAKKALMRAQRIVPAPPKHYAHYTATGYQKDKGEYRIHFRCDGVCLADNPLQAAMRQNPELVRCDKVRIAVFGG